MAKALPVVGIVGAVLAALCFAVLAPPATILVVPAALAASVILVAQRTVAGAVAGLLVLGLAVLATLGVLGSVTTEDGGSTDFGISEDLGIALAAITALAIAIAAIALRWDLLEPRWLAIGGLVCAAAAALLAYMDQEVLLNHFRPGTFIGAGLSLLVVVPLARLLRAPVDDPLTQELVAADAPVRKPAAAPPPPPRRP